MRCGYSILSAERHDDDVLTAKDRRRAPHAVLLHAAAVASATQGTHATISATHLLFQVGELLLGPQADDFPRILTFMTGRHVCFFFRSTTTH